MTNVNAQKEFDEVADRLVEAARTNNADLCGQLYGQAKTGNIFVNARALRVGAENKSYEAFERMLEISGKEAFAATVYSIGLGPDWDKVQEIGKSDVRIKAALDRYESQIGFFFTSLHPSFFSPR